jgi:hypothetical protein
MQRPRLVANVRELRGVAMVRSLGDRRLSAQPVFFLYAALTILWVWILSFTQLLRTYPFLALAFAIMPALGCQTVVDAL